MGFQKHNWISYGRQGDVVSIEIKDPTGRRIDSFNTNNNKDYAKILKIIKDKYGFSPEVDVKDSINFDKEKSWLFKD